MTPERWEAVQRLFDAARDREGRARDAFLDAACAGDAELRAEVASLLDADADAPSDFLEAPVLSPTSFVPAQDVESPAAAPVLALVPQPGAWTSPGGSGTPLEVDSRPDSTADGAAPPAPPRFSAGDVLAGRYRVRRFLARGGMGEVYEADDTELGVVVALKTIRTPTRPRSVDVVKREILLARTVTHPYVCRVHDLGHHRDGQDDMPFLSMELLAGTTLADRLRSRGAMRSDEALPHACEMAEALAAAHAAGVVHGDFKSANVMLVPRGGRERAVVTDFGIASLLEPASHGESPAAPPLVGTPTHVSPEQVRGKRSTPSSDLYSLGVVLYEMVTGRLPFSAESPHAMALKRLVEEPTPPSRIVDDLDARWEAVILRLLRRKPEERFGSAAEVARALTSDDPLPVGTMPCTVPPEHDAFVGRDEELRALVRRQRAGSRLVTVTGPPGTGKTRLARRHALMSLGTWPGGACHADLTDVQTEAGIVAAVARGLGITLATHEPVEQVGHALARRGRCLVLLDNFEHVAQHAEATLSRWLGMTADACFVVTSREPLGLDAEVPFALGTLPDMDARALFAVRARARRPSLVLGLADDTTVGSIVKALDCLPLAIELAAARMHLLSLEQVQERLRERFGLLSGEGGSSARHATLREAIDWSWELLKPWERSAFAQCAVFEGGFSLEGVEAVMNLDGWPEAPSILDVVQRLVDASLIHVEFQPAGGGARFYLLASLHEYARQKLGDDPVLASRAEIRHGRYHATFGTSETLDALEQHGGAERGRALRPRIANFEAACRRAIARDDGPTAVDTLAAVVAAVELGGPYGLAVELGDAVLALAGLSPLERARAQSLRGQALVRVGRLAEATTDLAAARDEAERAGDRRAAARDSYHLGRILGEMGRMDEARHHVQAALVLHRELGDVVGEARDLARLGTLDWRQTRLAEARDGLTRALAIFREHGAHRAEAKVLTTLGGVEQSAGRLDEARGHFERILAMHVETADRDGEAIAACNVAIVYLEQARLDDAESCFRRSLAINRELGHRRNEAVVLGNLGTLHHRRGQFADARRWWEESLALHRAMTNVRAEGTVLRNLGLVAVQEGRLDAARVMLAEALEIARRLDATEEEAAALDSLGYLAAEEGRFDEARATFLETVRKLRERGAEQMLGRVLCMWAETEGMAGDPARALELLAEAEHLEWAITSTEGWLKDRIREVRSGLPATGAGSTTVPRAEA